MDTFRLILVGAALVQFTLWLILAGRYKAPPAAPDAVVLRYGWKLRLLGLCIAFAIPILMILLFAVTPLRQTPLLIPIGVLLFVCGCIGGVLLLETQGVYIIVSPETISSISPWRRRREWRWHEIERVTYSFINRWLVLHGPQQQSIRASLLLVGISALAQEIRRHVSGMKWSPARKVVERLATS